MRGMFGGLRVRVGLSAVVLLGLASTPTLRGDEDSPPPEAAPPAEAAGDAWQRAVDKPIDIHLRSGAIYEKATLLRLVSDDDGKVASLRVRLDTGRSRSIRLDAIALVKLEGEELYRSAGEVPAKPKSKKELKDEEEAQRKAKEHEEWL